MVFVLLCLAYWIWCTVFKVIVSCITTLFLFFMAEQYAAVWTYHSLYIHSFVGHLHCSHLLVILNSVIVNICIQVSVGVSIFNFVSYFCFLFLRTMTTLTSRIEGLFGKILEKKMIGNVRCRSRLDSILCNQKLTKGRK